MGKPDASKDTHKNFETCQILHQKQTFYLQVCMKITQVKSSIFEINSGEWTNRI